MEHRILRLLGILGLILIIGLVVYTGRTALLKL